LLVRAALFIREPSREEYYTVDSGPGIEHAKSLVTTGVPPLLRAEAPHKLPIRTLVAASVGNAVEWYDWTVYATFSIYFATQIFSAEKALRSSGSKVSPMIAAAASAPA
jgi:hypothetical protein